MGKKKNKKKDKSSGREFYKILKKHVGEEITFRTRSGDVITGVLGHISKNSLLEIVEAEMLSPFMSERVRHIMLDDIESFSVEITPGNGDDDDDDD
ncbi:hypothetical protein FAY30_03205 [Bacillus sp. S3]|uniref:hypothetical protein n=1 Tax=Bacillus sp. S3 TaxID=486398 RepID=UPI001189F425|nr:hypothetical protein [Bacillus sp. S3]QCJ40996.1 hypothetical protein FAY30_03205 [Bacillus sp. S3]